MGEPRVWSAMAIGGQKRAPHRFACAAPESLTVSLMADLWRTAEGHPFRLVFAVLEVGQPTTRGLGDARCGSPWYNRDHRGLQQRPLQRNEFVIVTVIVATVWAEATEVNKPIAVANKTKRKEFMS